MSGASLLEQPWGEGASLAPRLQAPQDSQADSVIGKRQDIPRETHLHAWVTPAAACFLTPQEIRPGSLLWEDGASFHGNPQLPHPSLEGRKKASRNSSRNISLRLLPWWGKARLIPSSKSGTPCH